MNLATVKVETEAMDQANDESTPTGQRPPEKTFVINDFKARKNRESKAAPGAVTPRRSPGEEGKRESARREDPQAASPRGKRELSRKNSGAIA